MDIKAEMLLVKDLDSNTLEYIYDYCSNPNTVDLDKRRIGIGNFIYSCMAISDIPDEMDIDEILNLMELYDKHGDILISRLLNDPSSITVIDIYKSTLTMIEYSDRNIPYPVNEILDIYHKLDFDNYSKIRSIYQDMRPKYTDMYNDMTESKDEIMGSVNFIVSYLNYTFEILPDINKKLHLLVSYMVINYYLMTSNYNLPLPIYNGDKIISIIADTPWNEIKNKYKYKLMIGNYLLSGLDVALDVYYDGEEIDIIEEEEEVVRNIPEERIYRRSIAAAMVN